MTQTIDASPLGEPLEKEILDLLNQLQRLDPQNLESVLQNYPEISLSQRRLWTLHRLDPSSDAYNVPVLLKIEGALNVAALNLALQEIISRHEVLRSVFFPIQDSARLLLLENSAFRLPVVTSPESEWNHASETTLIRDFVSAPFELTKQIGLRGKLISYGDDKHVLALIFHHLVIDGWSMGLFFKELKEFYSAKSEGRSSNPQEPIQYAAFSKWEHELNQKGDFPRQTQFWKNLLSSDAPQVNLCGNPELAMASHGKADQIEISLPASFVEAVRSFARQNGCSLFSLLMSGFHALNFRYTRSERIVIGTTTFNRKLVAFEKMIGFFVNTLAIPSSVDEKTSFLQLLSSLGQTIQEANTNDSVPFDQVASSLQLQARSDNQLFRIALELQRSPYDSFQLPGLRLSSLECSARSAKFDLTLFFFESDSDLSLKIEFDSSAYSRSQAARIGSNLVNLISAAMAKPNQPISRLAFPTETSVALSGPKGAIADTDLWSVFEKTARQFPNRIAIRAAGRAVTFADAYAGAQAIGAQIQLSGLKSGNLVGIIADRSLESILAVLGTWASGNGYVPIDPNSPDRRRQLILEDSGLKLVLKSRQANFESSKVIVRTIEDLMQRDSGSFRAGISELPYVIYTSGSTGAPKACGIRRSNILNLMHAFEETLDYSVEHPICVSLNAPLYFDASIQQLVMLLRGHTLCVVPEDVRADAVEFAEWISKEEIQLLDCTPSHLKLLLLEQFDFRCLKKVLVGGEPISIELWNQMLEISKIEFYNVYGPTECTVDSTIHRIQKSSDRPVIGKPIRNAIFKCVDADLNPLPLEIPGELVISGAGVGMGYYGDSELTSKKFIATDSYRTGDVVRFLGNDEVEFLGRIDDQVKIRGHRIELPEIEYWLRRGKSVQDAVALLENPPRGQAFIHAYLVATNEESIDLPGLLTHLRENMPEYCIPSKFSLVSEVPLNPNGKVDKSKLRSHANELVSRPSSDVVEYAPPMNLLEVQLVRLWKNLFGHERFDVHSNFFHLGGQSIMAAHLLSQIRSTIKINLPSAVFFRNPTIRQLASALSQGSNSNSNEHLVEICKGDASNIPIFCLHPMGGNVLVYGPLGSLHSRHPVYGIQSKALINPELEYESYEQMCEEYGRVIFENIQTKACYLLGWSLGGLVALKVAEFLEERGIRILGIDLWDCGVREEFLSAPQKLDLVRGYASVMNTLASAVGHELTPSDLEEIRLIINEAADHQFGKGLLEWGKAKWKLQIQIEADFVDRVAKLSSIHAQLFYNFRIPRVNANIHAVWTAHSLQNKLLFKNNWNQFTSRNYSEEILLHGTHYSMMKSHLLSDLLSGLESRVALANLIHNTTHSEQSVRGSETYLEK